MKKKIFIVQMLDSKNPSGKSFTQVNDALFYSNDTDAHLVFLPHEQESFEFNEATVALYNLDDESLVERPAVIETFEGRKSVVLKMTEDLLAHWGRWQAQVVFKQGDKINTSVVVKFDTLRYMLDQRPPTLRDVIKVDELYSQLVTVMDEIAGKDVISAPEIILARGEHDTLGERLDNEHNEITTQLSEVAEARGGENTLGERLDKEYNEVIQARGGENTLGERLDKEYNEVATQLAHIESREVWVNASGSEDDSLAFQTAINESNTGVVYVPSGTFRVKDVTIPKDMAIIGTGETIIKPILKNGNRHYPHNVFAASDVNSVRIENVKFHGDVTTNESSTVVKIPEYTLATLHFDTVKDVKLIDCEFANISFLARKSTPLHFTDRRGMITALDCDSVTIDGCRFSKIWGEETNWILPRIDKKQVVEITNCLIEDYEPTCYSAFGIIGGTITVKGNTFRNCTNTNSPLNILGKYVVVESNIFDNLRCSIAIDTCEGSYFINDTVVIANNEVRNCLYSIACQINPDMGYIHGNYFEVREGIRIGNNPLAPEDKIKYHDIVYTNFRPCTFINIHDNTFNHSKDTSITSSFSGYSLNTSNTSTSVSGTTGTRSIESLHFKNNKCISEKTRRNGCFTRINYISKVEISNNHLINPGIVYGSSSLTGFFSFNALDYIIINNNEFEAESSDSKIIVMLAYQDTHKVTKRIVLERNKSNYPFVTKTAGITEALIVKDNQNIGTVDGVCLSLNRENLDKAEVLRGDSLPIRGKYLQGDIIYKNTLEVGQSMGWAILSDGYFYMENRVDSKRYLSGVFIKYSDGSIWMALSNGLVGDTEPDISGASIGDIITDGVNRVYKVGTEPTVTPLPIL